MKAESEPRRGSGLAVESAQVCIKKKNTNLRVLSSFDAVVCFVLR